MLIYVDQISERITFVLDFIFNERSLPYELTNDSVYFVDYKGAKFNLSEKYFEHCLQVVPSKILQSESIVSYEIAVSTFHVDKCLSFDGITDVLGSIFYVLSRYEEYGDVMVDSHGRVMSENSVLALNGWLQELKCERWSELFIDFLKDHMELVPKKIPARFIASFDIDNAYAYKHRDGVRLLGSYARDLLKSNKNRLKERKAVRNSELKDPYDTFDKIIALKDRVDDVKVFWLLADYSKYNRNIRFNHPKQARLIRQLAERVDIGIHPGYESWNNRRLIEDQLKRLKTILNHNISSSRQHFLKFRFPTTFKNLQAAGIRNDYSLGYSDAIGFRSGTARPYPFFDLVKNEITELTIHPFAYMDGTLKDYLKLSIEESILRTNRLIDEVKRYGGDFIPIWHNETIGDYGRWTGWSIVLDENIKYFYNEQ